MAFCSDLGKCGRRHEATLRVESVCDSSRQAKRSEMAVDRPTTQTCALAGADASGGALFAAFPSALTKSLMLDGNDTYATPDKVRMFNRGDAPARGTWAVLTDPCSGKAKVPTYLGSLR